ncbi:aromatic ring-hydroxylating oxygenase subunit alpha [Oceanicoccus sagamiensis]|uniref:Ring-hydroxylating oxygenase subunit alpha n=1 Tax=Oceanicoccus sagamiensis TaxID=716816 RepID=A0A1X9NGP6_9GAMM|nr:aromatic ring-hydroxylating dioxygenase subunit alpha [Oceanicoccus sagamiensis]ARN74679.1 ring-hydroxylating oxygenase subunit alpha [Oceanicoccus sagamiensis]
MTDKIAGYNGLTQTEATLPAAYYLDAAHYERELAAIWYRNWVYVCRADELQQPRAFRTLEIGSQNILVLRDDQGELQAFHNTCRHRGSILCTETEGTLRSRSLVCPYHSWSYSLQGELQRTPSKHTPDDFNKADYPLYDVAVIDWQGFVFVNLEGSNAIPFEQSLQEDNANLDNWPLAELKLGHVYKKTMDCNWKIFWENFNECLHCPSVHPELSKLVPIYSRAFMEAQDDPNWAEHQGSDDPRLVGGMSPEAQTWSFDGQPSGETFAGLTDEQRQVAYHYVVSKPSVFIVAHIDYVRIVRLLPLGPEKTEIQAQWLFSEANLADDNVDIERVAEFAKLVMDQDARVSEINQKGLRSIKHQQGVLMAEEYAVHDFQNWVRQQLED